MNYDNAKVLLRISNLKQYFPLKTKGQFVKANDGISLDIYEGEVFGLVGESGCGKSTLGRSLLQLYKQTDGRTMYYGKNLLDMAPEYAFDTLKHLDAKKKHMQEAAAKLEKEEAHYNSLSDEEKMHRKNELDKYKKEAHDALLDVANLVGGLIVSDDLGEVKSTFLALYESAKKRKKAREELVVLQLELGDIQNRVDKGLKGGSASKLESLKTKIAAKEKDVEALEAAVAQNQAAAEALRERNRSHADFDKYEAYFDEGVDLARLSYHEMRLLRSDLQLIFQDPYSSLNPRFSVGQIISEGMRTHHLLAKNDSRTQDKVLSVMESCGLAPYFLHRYPHQFSGGQRQRIGIARSLAVEPKFVVCDEAVSALDVSIQSQIINLLYDLREERNLTYMFITHDLSVVKYISDRIGVMYLGNMVELAYSEDIFKKPMHPYTQALITAIPTTDPDQDKELQILEGDIPSPVNPPEGCKFHTRCRYCTEICKHAVPDWVELEPHHYVACHHPLLSGSEQER